MSNSEGDKERDVYMDVLSREDVIPLILFIKNRKETIRTDLKKVSTAHDRVARTARELEEIGIIRIHGDVGSSRKKFYELTDKGKKIANVFQEAVDIARR